MQRILSLSLDPLELALLLLGLLMYALSLGEYFEGLFAEIKILVAPDHGDGLGQLILHLHGDIVIILRIEAPDDLEELGHQEEHVGEIFRLRGRLGKGQTQPLPLGKHALSIVFVDLRVLWYQFRKGADSCSDLVLLPGHGGYQLLFGNERLVHSGTCIGEHDGARVFHRGCNLSDLLLGVGRCLIKLGSAPRGDIGVRGSLHFLIDIIDSCI